MSPRPQARRLAWLAAGALLLVLSLGGFLLARKVARDDQRSAAIRRAADEQTQAEILLERAKRYVVGLSELLGSEPTAGERRFTFLAGATITSFDLVDALWVEPVRGHLIARYATTVPPGADVSSWPGLATTIGGQGTVFAATATGIGTLHGSEGFWLVQSGRFGIGAASSGYLAVFVPRGWVTLSLGVDPRETDVLLDGQRLEGALAGRPAAHTTFDALEQSWRIDVAAPPAASIDAALPWLALAWPWAAGLLAFVIGSAVVRRRRAEHEVERIFDLSLDLLAVASSEGRFVHVNPAFSRTLGYSAAELTSRPFLDFVEPEDRPRTVDAVARLARGEEVVQFENRYRRRDGSLCWLEWSVHPVPQERRLYAAARDVTARREVEERIRATERDLRASRDLLRRLADEHAAVRRVATLVARGGAPAELFGAVAREVRALLAADAAVLLRCEAEQRVRTVAVDAEPRLAVELDACDPIAADGLAARIVERHRADPTRQTACTGAPEPRLRRLGLQTAVAAAIVVDGGLWGMLEVAWLGQGAVAPEAPERVTHFTELVATAIANAHSRAELLASRARVVAAADDARRRIERDLHDGTQQRLIALLLALRVAEARIPPHLEELRAEIDAVAQGLTAANAELQELARGIHPAILSRGGLALALRTLVNRSHVPVELAAEIGGRLDPRVEVAVYYLVSESLANAAKHAHASHVSVRLATEPAALEVLLSDDGVGGADPSRGSGLLGLVDRVQACGGTLEIRSNPGQGTHLRATFPLAGDGRESAPALGAPPAVS